MAMASKSQHGVLNWITQVLGWDYVKDVIIGIFAKDWVVSSQHKLGALVLAYAFLRYRKAINEWIPGHFPFTINKVIDIPKYKGNTNSSSPLPHETHFDVIIVGAGMAGSVLAMILAKEGISTLVLEGGQHPRYALGETSTGETAIWWKILAARYELPELFYLSSFRGVKKFTGHNHGRKNVFGFMYHNAGQPFDARQSVQTVPFNKGPFGTDVHFFRQDIDYYLLSAAMRYGCKVIQNAKVANLEISLEHGIDLLLSDNRRFHGEYLVDGSGFSGVVAKFLDLRDRPTRFKTATRTLFNHFLDVPKYEDVVPNALLPEYPVGWNVGTIHHMFDGGWIWVIPFNNHEESANNITSAGLLLDIKKYPKQPNVTPEEEWDFFMKKFPSIGAHFEGAFTIRNWVATDRMQYSCKHAAGDRWAMMPHSAGNVDALFSRGLVNTFEVITELSTRLLLGFKKPRNDIQRFSYQNFEFIDRLQITMLDSNDEMINTAYNCLADWKLMRAWLSVWLLANFLGAIWKLRTYVRFIETGDYHILDYPNEHSANPGLVTPTAKGWDEFTLSCATFVQRFVDGEISAETARQGIMKNLNTYPFIPPLKFIQDDTVPIISLNDAIVFPSMVLWGKLHAPEELKNYLFDWSPLTILRLFPATFWDPIPGQVY